MFKDSAHGVVAQRTTTGQCLFCSQKHGVVYLRPHTRKPHGGRLDGGRGSQQAQGPTEQSVRHKAQLQEQFSRAAVSNFLAVRKQAFA